jgi:hypothetical protein
MQAEHSHDVTKSQGEWEDGKERIIKFVSAAYAPENLLKVMGCNAQQLKEQQELRITEGLCFLSFFLPRSPLTLFPFSMFISLFSPTFFPLCCFL